MPSTQHHASASTWMGRATVALYSAAAETQPVVVVAVVVVVVVVEVVEVVVVVVIEVVVS